MSEMPKVIYAGQDESDGYAYWFHVPQEEHHNCPKYLRADLFEQGKRWMRHDDWCRHRLRGEECTCDLSKYLEEVGK